MIKNFSRYVLWVSCLTLYTYAQSTENRLLTFSDTPYIQASAQVDDAKKGENPIDLAESALLTWEDESKEEPIDIKEIPAIALVAEKKRKETVAKKVVEKPKKIIPKTGTTKKAKIAKKVTPVKQIEKKKIYHDNNETKSTKVGITLKEAILLSLKKSYKISSQREKVIQAKRKLDEKIAAYRPTLNLTANAGGAYLSPYQADEQKFLKSDESLVLNQNIYAGGKHSNEIKREKANLYAAQEKFKSQVEEETLKVIDAYLSLIYQQMGIEITRNNMLSLQKILEIVTAKEAAGASTKGDLNYIKSQVENASSALVKAESKYQNAIAFYEYYVGKLDDTNRPVEYEFVFELDDKETTLNTMYENNAKMQVAKAKMEAESLNLKAQKSKFRPTLDFSITAKDKQSGYISEPQEDRATALLSFNLNLYNGGKDKAVVLGTKSKIAELQFKLIDLKESTEYNTKQMYENILSSLDSLKHTQKEVDANLLVVDSYWAAFKYGTQDIQALLLAQRALNRSELDVIKEKQAYTNGYFKLMQQTGTLLQTLDMHDFIDAKKIIQNKSINYF